MSDGHGQAEHLLLLLHSALLATTVHGTSCDPCGASASYTETIDDSGAL